MCCHGVCSRLVFVALTLFRDIFEQQLGSSHIIVDRAMSGSTRITPTIMIGFFFATPCAAQMCDVSYMCSDDNVLNMQ